MVSRQREWQLKMKSQGRCAVCGEPAVTASYCEFHRQRDKEKSSDRYFRRKDERSQIIKSIIEETHMSGKKYVVREDKQGRCYVSLIQQWEGQEFYDDIVLVYKGTARGEENHWEDTAKKICDLLNEQDVIENNLPNPLNFPEE